MYILSLLTFKKKEYSATIGLVLVISLYSFILTTFAYSLLESLSYIITRWYLSLPAFFLFFSLAIFFLFHVFQFLCPSVLVESNICPSILFSIYYGYRWPFMDTTSLFWAPNTQWMVALLHLDIKCIAQAEYVQNLSPIFPSNTHLSINSGVNTYCPFPLFFTTNPEPSSLVSAFFACIYLPLTSPLLTYLNLSLFLYWLTKNHIICTLASIFAILQFILPTSVGVIFRKCKTDKITSLLKNLQVFPQMDRV